MKKILFIILMTITALNVNAEWENKKFNPQQFRRNQEMFIIKDAHLSQQEAAAFFPLFREMQDKQRTLFRQQRELQRKKPANDNEAEEQINKMNNLEIQIIKLRAHYHKKLMKAIPATKVKLCIRAEERFKHRMMDRLTRARHNDQKGQPKQQGK